MHRPSAEEFVLSLLPALEDLPPDLVQRLVEIMKQPPADRAQALKQLFEEFAGD